MPGPAPALRRRAGRRRAGRRRSPRPTLDAHVTRLLAVFDRLGALDDDPDRRRASSERPARSTGRSPREAATDGNVLLRNDGVLPARPRRAAVASPCIGPNADRPQIMGGGSAKLRAALPDHAARGAAQRASATDVEVVHERGCRHRPHGARAARRLARSTLDAARAGRRGAAERDTSPAPQMLTFGAADRRRPRVTLVGPHGTFTPDATARTRSRSRQAGGARLLVGGEVVLDGVADPPPPGAGDVRLRVSEEVAARSS